MKRILLLTALVPMFTNAQTTIFEENFDAYTAGDYAGVVSQYMTSWSENPGGFDDCQISATQANTPANSIEIVGQSGPMDAVCQFPDSYDGIGEYRFSMMMYIPTGFAGYFNCQESQTPGLGWKCDVFFAINGTGYVSAEGNATFSTFNYPKDQWFEVIVDADLYLDQGKVTVNGTASPLFMWSTGVAGDEFLKRWGGINYYAYGPNDEQCNYFVDDLKLEDVTDYTSVDQAELIDLTIYPNPSEGQFAVTWSNGEAYDVQVLDLTGKVVYSELKAISNQTFNLNLAAGSYVVSLVNETNKIERLITVK